MSFSVDYAAFAKVKLSRVAIHLNEINGIIGGLVKAADTYEILADADGKETIHFLVGPPPEIQAIAGEIIYQFKSTLDQFAFQLVESNPQKISLPKRWDRNCYFPLLLDIPTHSDPSSPYTVPVPYEFFERNLPGISKAAYAFIESVQPYHSGPGVHNILRIIANLANIDKHKHPYALLPRIAVKHDFMYPNGFTGASIRGGLKHGAEIPLLDEFPRADSPLNVNRSFIPYVTFDETIGAGPDTLGTEDLMRTCLEHFEAFIVPTFIKLIQ